MYWNETYMTQMFAGGKRHKSTWTELLIRLIKYTTVALMKQSLWLETY